MTSANSLNGIGIMLLTRTPDRGTTSGARCSCFGHCSYLEAWCIQGVADRPEDYYEDSVTLLCLLVMTGNWWDPAAQVVATCRPGNRGIVLRTMGGHGTLPYDDGRAVASGRP